MWEIFSRGHVPYAGWNNKKVIEKTATGSRLSPPSEMPETVQPIMNSCWEEDPNLRPSFAEIKKEYDPYFSANPKKDCYTSSSSLFTPENRYHNKSEKQAEHAYAHNSNKVDADCYNTDDENERYNTRVSLIIDPSELPLPVLDGPEDFYNNTSSQTGTPFQTPREETPQTGENFYNN